MCTITGMFKDAWSPYSCLNTADTEVLPQDKQNKTYYLKMKHKNNVSNSSVAIILMRMLPQISL